MSNKICIIYTATNGLHSTYDKVSKKNVYAIGRLVMLNYSIGTYDKDLNYVEEKNVYQILKPENIHYNDEAVNIHKITYDDALKKGVDSKEILKQFKEDLKSVKILISHSLEFHLKSLQAECFNAYESINFGKYILIDTMNFYHNFSFPKLVDLESKLKLKKSKNNIEKISKIFGKLYSEYNKSITL